MIVICAWCGLQLSISGQAKTPPEISHGICSKCCEKVLADFAISQVENVNELFFKPENEK